jgi:putative transposase
MTRRKQDTELLTLMQGGELGGELLKGIVEYTVQHLLEGEMERFLGAGVYERTEERRGYRNGYKPRSYKTRVGRLELQVPQDREGRFQTELFERYQRNEQALVLSLMEMVVQGVSTRKVKSITETLCGIEFSKSQVSELSKGLDGKIAQWRNRRLEGAYPYLMVDARYEKVRVGGRVVSRGALVVIGISEAGYREILGTWVADTESEATWSEVFRDLRERGLTGVWYVVSDQHKGLVLAIRRYFQGAVWQRCQVHFTRNILGLVSSEEGRKMVLQHLREITQAQTREAAEAAIRKAVETLEGKYPKVAKYLEEQGEDILGVYCLPEGHRKRMRTTNMLERFNEEIRRRTRVVRIFPNEDSCLRLVSALAMETSEEWQQLIYLNMNEVNSPVPV